MSTEGAPNKRRTSRIERRLPVRFGTEARMCGGFATDISEGGLRVESPESFPVNSLVTVFVQFPRHAVRLQARVAWSGGQNPIVGLALTSPSPALQKALAQWLAEVKDAKQKKRETEGDAVGALPAGPSAAKPDAAPAPEPAAPPSPAVKTPKPPQAGVVSRRIETMTGQAYDVLIERIAGTWYLTIHQFPRQASLVDADFQDTYSDYAAAERALREFTGSH
jgi:hypothetical protein